MLSSVDPLYFSLDLRYGDTSLYVLITPQTMLPIIYTFACLAVVGLTSLIRAMISAPYATEDKNGFHTNLPSESESQGVMWNAAEMSFFHR